MAKSDNLTDFLTGVANVIRTKKGTTAKINPQNFESEIEGIDGNKFVGLIQRTIKTVTADDLQGVTSIGGYAFYNCSGLTSVTIPEGVTSIGDYAFNGCSGLTSVTIPDGVTSIGSSAFNGCSSLINITMLPTTPPTLGSSAIPLNVTTITVPVGCGNAYKTAKGWSAYAEKIVEATV